MTTDRPTETNTFVVRVVCGNCLTEYDHRSPIGTRFDMEGYGGDRRLVTIHGGFTSGMGYVPSSPVACNHCGVPALSRKLRTA